jgi:6-phosphogluconolactonase
MDYKNLERIMQTFNSNSDLIKTLSLDIKFIVENAIQEKGKAHLLLSGGSTPLPLYKSIADFDLDWENIHIGLVDERFVDQSSGFSNEALIKNVFQKLKTSNFSSMVINQFDLTKNLEEVSLNYAPFMAADIVLLGMGEDGHTASIFPNDPMSEQAIKEENAGICYTNSPNHPINRITCNRSMLISSSHVFLYFTGLKKLDKFKLAKEEETPISHFESQLTEVYFTENA